jgi:hypothetical protein
MNKRSIILRGCPEVNEYGAAGEAILPGMLVKGITALLLQTSFAKVAPAVALERDELGAGIDNLHRTAGTIDASYQIGDTVKVATFAQGQEATMYVASGENISEDDYLQSAGDGTLTESGPYHAFSICRSLETLGLCTAPLTAVRVQFV